MGIIAKRRDYGSNAYKITSNAYKKKSNAYV